MSKKTTTSPDKTLQAEGHLAQGDPQAGSPGPKAIP